MTRTPLNTKTLATRRLIVFSAMMLNWKLKEIPKKNALITLFKLQNVTYMWIALNQIK